MGFDADTALAPVGPGAWEGRIDPRWEVVRGPLGGYVAAIVVRALTAVVADEERPLRSLTVHFLRPPLPGPVQVTARVERAGRGMTTASARLEQDDRPCALALAAFAGGYPGPDYDDAPMPAVAPPGERVPPPAGDTPLPPFTANMTMQPRFGAPPFSGADRAEVGGWLGLLDEPDRPLDAPLVVTLADAWFPAPFPRLTGPGAAPTIDFTVHLRAPLPRPDASLVLGRFTSRVSRDGFFEEDGELWTPDGVLVAQSRQLALLLG